MQFNRLCVQSLAVLSLLSWSGAACAWSSKNYPMFQEVHQLAIKNVLGSTLNATALQQLQDEQDAVDRDQAAANSDKHAMTGITAAGQNVAAQKQQYIAKAETLVRKDLELAIQSRTSPNGDSGKAMAALGQAIHALEDATSPVHGAARDEGAALSGRRHAGALQESPRRCRALCLRHLFGQDAAPGAIL
jgi:hypothetical protein